MTRPTCPYCGEAHERHEDAACGCSCGSEPMGCGECMREGGPVSLAQKQRYREQAYRDLDEFGAGGEWE